MYSITAVLKFPFGIRKGIMSIFTNGILLSNKKQHILIKATWKDLNIMRLQERNQIQNSRIT